MSTLNLRAGVAADEIGRTSTARRRTLKPAYSEATPWRLDSAAILDDPPGGSASRSTWWSTTHGPEPSDNTAAECGRTTPSNRGYNGRPLGGIRRPACSAHNVAAAPPRQCAFFFCRYLRLQRDYRDHPAVLPAGNCGKRRSTSRRRIAASSARGWHARAAPRWHDSRPLGHSITTH